MGKWALYLMAKLRGIDCFAITDHNEVAGALKYKPWLESKGIQVIVGEEVFTTEGEIIGLFLKERIQPGLTPEETIEEIRQQDGIVYLPHPYDEKRNKTVLSESAQIRLAKSFDCVEIHNGRNIKRSFSKIQKDKALKLHLLPVVGGDSHVFFEVGRNICITKKPFTRENFIDLLNNARFQTLDCLAFAHQVTRLVRIKKLIAKGDYDGLRRAVNRKLARRK